MFYQIKIHRIILKNYRLVREKNKNETTTVTVTKSEIVDEVDESRRGEKSRSPSRQKGFKRCIIRRDRFNITRARAAAISRFNNTDISRGGRIKYLRFGRERRRRTGRKGMLRPAAAAAAAACTTGRPRENATRLNIYEFLRSLVSMMDDARAGDAYFRALALRAVRRRRRIIL